MEDIVERARELGEPTTTTGQLWLDLADELEKLRAENTDMKRTISLFHQNYTAIRGEAISLAGYVVVPRSLVTAAKEVVNLQQSKGESWDDHPDNIRLREAGDIIAVNEGKLCQLMSEISAWEDTNE